jgi:hypothetical protein
LTILSSDEEILKTINSLRESFLVHSYLYYHAGGKEIISDLLFDARARHLYRLQRENPHLIDKGIYPEYFINFSPETGCDAPVDEFVIGKSAKYMEDYNKRMIRVANPFS